MPRRGENIYKRKDGRWEGRYIKSRLPDGKAKYGYIYADTYKQIKAKLKTITHTANTPDKSSTSGTYSELLFKWLQSKRIIVKESTFTRYQRIVEAYIIPKLGNINASEISTESIENYIHTLLVTGRKDGKGGLSPKTVSDILVVIKSSLEYGRGNDYQVNCNTNHICIKRKEKEMRVLSQTEQNQFVAYLLDDTDLYKFGTLLSLYTGIRVGELSWCNNLIISVQQTFITELNQIAEKHDDIYIQELINKFSASQAAQNTSGECYVATCVYGSYDCPQVWTLRRFRDYTLAETWYGRAFVHTYYAISPTLVKWFGHTNWFKKCGKANLTVWLINSSPKV